MNLFHPYYSHLFTINYGCLFRLSVRISELFLTFSELYLYKHLDTPWTHKKWFLCLYTLKFNTFKQAFTISFKVLGVFWSLFSQECRLLAQEVEETSSTSSTSTESTAESTTESTESTTEATTTTTTPESTMPDGQTTSQGLNGGRTCFSSFLK